MKLDVFKDFDIVALGLLVFALIWLVILMVLLAVTPSESL